MTRYDEIMGRIEVTGEMRARILQKIEQADIAPPKKAAKVLRFPRGKKYMAAAACLAVLLLGVFALPLGQQGGQSTPGGELVVTPGFTGYASLDELRAAAGFSVPDAEGLLPFSVTERAFSLYDSTLAQADYFGEGGEEALLRVSSGTEDNSGDYNDYAAVATITVPGVSGQLRGNSAGAYTLAVWSDGDYAYSLSLSVGMDEAAWNDLIAALMGQ